MAITESIRSAVALAWVADPFARTNDLAARFGVSRSFALAARPCDLPPLGMGRNRAGIRTPWRPRRFATRPEPTPADITSWVATLRSERHG